MTLKYLVNCSKPRRDWNQQMGIIPHVYACIAKNTDRSLFHPWDAAEVRACTEPVQRLKYERICCLRRESKKRVWYACSLGPGVFIICHLELRAENPSLQVLQMSRCPQKINDDM